MLDFRFKNKTKKAPAGPYILYASEADWLAPTLAPKNTHYAPARRPFATELTFS